MNEAVFGCPHMGASNPPTISDPAEAIFSLDPAVRRCPFDMFDVVRKREGMYYEPRIEAYVATRHADVMQVVRDPILFSSRLPFGTVSARRDREILEPLIATDPEVADLIKALKPRRTPVLVNCDPPDHMRQRRLVQGSFAGPRISQAQPMVAALANELIDAFQNEPEVDLVQAFTVPLPVRVIAKMLGADDDQREHFKRWSDDFMRAAGNEALSPEIVIAAMRGNAELYAYLRAQIDERRINPRDDLITSVMNARMAGDEPFSVDELLSMFSQFLVAGNESTTALLGSTLLALARDPEMADRLRADLTGIPRLIEEVLRREAPIQASFRRATADTEVGGALIKKGEQILMIFAAANRDSSVYGEERIDLDTKKPNHLAFGFGEHFCLGANLARMEVSTAVREFLTRFSSFSVPEGVTIDYGATYMVRSLLGLPMKLERARAGA